MKELLKLVLDSKLGQALGVSLIFIALFWVTWTQMNNHIEGRITSMSERIDELSAQNEFLQNHLTLQHEAFQSYVQEQQSLTRTLFSSIEKHLEDISRNYHHPPGE